MEFEESTPSMLQFDSPKDQSSYIKVIGVGGGGGNAVNHMYREGINGVDFIVCNTDMKALNSSPVPNKIVLGELGAGGKPEKARQRALEHKDDIREAISNNTQMLFITAGMGGGTGTGAAPVVAEIAKSIDVDDEEAPKILVVGVVTMPFSFEGSRKKKLALEGIAELRKYVDSILIINNDKLRSFGNLAVSEAFSKADDVLLTAVKGIAEIITVNSYINIDFHDVNTVMEGSGTALMGTGCGRGEDRAMQAIEEASTSVLLNDNNIAGAKDILLYFSFSSSHEVTMNEIEAVTDRICELTGNYDEDGNFATNVIWGEGSDDTLDDELKITLIATGFPQDKGLEGGKKGGTVTELKTEEKETPKVEAPVNDGDMRVVHRAETPTASEAAAPTARETEAPVCTEKKVYNLYEPDQAAQQVRDAYRSADEDICDQQYIDGICLKGAEASTSAPVREVEAPVMHVEAPVMHVEAPAPAVSCEVPVVEAQVAEVETPVMEAPAMQFEPLHHVEAAPEPVAPAPAAPATRYTQPIVDRQALSRAERIKLINQMLHDNPNGAEMVEQLTTEQLTGEEIYQAPHSSKSETSRTAMMNDGTMKGLNNFLFSNPD